MPTRKTLLILISVGALLVGGLIWALLGSGKKTEKIDNTSSSTQVPSNASSQSGLVVIPPDSPKLEQIRVEPVQMAELPTDEVTAPGKIEVNPHRVSHVVLPVAGRVATVLVKIGDRVAAGQPLLTLESPDAEAAMSAYLQAEAGVKQANAGLAKSEADLAKAQADYDRVKDLYEHNAVAQKEVLNAENVLAQSKAAVDTAKAGADQANALKEQALRRLDMLGLAGEKFGQKIQVRAPISGKVLDMSVAPGEYRNDTTTPLMTIADLRTVIVSSDVPENSIRLIQVGDRLEIHLVAYPNETFSGRVTRIADTVDPQARTVKVQAELDNSQGRLRPEMFGTIQLTKAVHQVPVLPIGAVIQGDGRNIVFVEKNRGRFQQTEVTLGKPAGQIIPVLSGVNAGDRVVVEGAMLLK